MKIKSSMLLNIILLTTLSASFFLVNTTATAPQYDPWKDLNDDGYIELMDFFELSQAFGASGNPTKPIVIAEHNWSHGLHEFLIAPEEEGNLSITTAGYKQITLGFKANSEPWGDFGNVSVATGFRMGISTGYNLHVYVDRFNVTLGWAGGQPPTLGEYPVVGTYDIRGQLLTIAYYNPNIGYAYRLVIEYYMTT